MHKFQFLSKRWILVVLFITLSIVSLSIGVSSLNFNELMTFDSKSWHILLTSRIPRTVAIVLSASGLSIAGLIMQSIGQNRFIAPSTIGTTDAALFGVLMTFLLLGSAPLLIKLSFAFIFALASSMFFMAMLQKIHFKEPIYVPLVGLMYGSIIGAFTTFIAHRYDALQVLSSIGLGSFTNITSGRYELLWIILFPLSLAYVFSSTFSLLRLGQDFTTNLGVNYKRVVFLGLVIVSIVSAASYVIVGPLPFVGLVIPNLVTLFYGDNIKKSIIDLALFGSIYVLANDILSRLLIFPYEISVSFMMGITGSMLFIWLILNRGNHGPQ